MTELRLLGSADLRDRDGRGALSVLAQPKRLALLAWLTRATGFHRRDTIIGLFWPELDVEHARAALVPIEWDRDDKPSTNSITLAARAGQLNLVITTRFQRRADQFLDSRITLNGSKVR
jgi:hypothetical protein